MKILAFAGSNSSKSINKDLVAYTTTLFKGDTIEILDLNDYEMPLFSSDRAAENGIHPMALDFAQKIDESDLLIISLAEHNGSYAVAFKNIFDWVSRIQNRKAFGNKPILLMSTSPGARGGATVLEAAKGTFPYFGGEVHETFVFPNFYENFDPSKGIVNEKFKLELQNKTQSVKTKILEDTILVNPN